MIVAVYGSPRKCGNTDILMDAFLEPLKQCSDIERFYLRDLVLKPCIACGGCERTGVCIFRDDIWNIYEKIDSIKAIIISSPVFFGSLTAQVKAFIDRAQAFWARKYLLGREDPLPGRKGFFICAGAIDTDKYFLNSRAIVQTHMKILDIKYSGDLFFSGVDKKGDIIEKTGALDAAGLAGTEFSRIL